MFCFLSIYFEFSFNTELRLRLMSYFFIGISTLGSRSETQRSGAPGERRVSVCMLPRDGCLRDGAKSAALEDGPITGQPGGDGRGVRTGRCFFYQLLVSEGNIRTSCRWQEPSYLSHPHPFPGSILARAQPVTRPGTALWDVGVFMSG